MLPRDVVFEIHCRDYINRHAISDKEYLKVIYILNGGQALFTKNFSE